MTVAAVLSAAMGLSVNWAHAQAAAVGPTAPAVDPRTQEAQQRAMMAHKRASQIATNQANERKLLAAHATPPAAATHRAHRGVGVLADRATNGRRAGVHPAPRRVPPTQTASEPTPHEG